jgi:hypothetical protein
LLLIVVNVEGLIGSLPLHCEQCFIFQFPDVARVASIIPWQISIELANLFQETLKTVANRHKCGDTIPKKSKFSVAFWRIVFLKNREFVTEYFFFRRLCRHLAIFRQKKSHCEGTLIYIYI